MKFLFIIISFFVFNTISAQKQLKYKFSIEKESKKEVLSIIKNELGDSTSSKKNKIFWVENKDNYDYKVSVNGKKIQIYYLGKSPEVEKRIKDLYSELKDK